MKAISTGTQKIQITLEHRGVLHSLNLPAKAPNLVFQVGIYNKLEQMANNRLQSLREGSNLGLEGYQ
ncbi:hypothetical protein FGO68_gene13468 [Halteria grandinella]|uniref:Uncharacterized protein n=1 Tax=Halteria grandinella TaxID=5974 RepID=A0A8J8SUM0_HALGN|nr:hypothetical protein FGO68_gene13468 [Halteria grandinella]